ncbi:MAG: phage major capsid protein [Burkholderiaceae bacterium]|nr:phage major capsid protein [Burkholderiaceae bacterium]
MNPTHFRYFDAPATDSGVEASLASDVPYARSGYTEVLVCTPDAVDLSRAGDGLPLLLHHDSTRLIGRVYDIRAEGSRVRGRLTFFDTAEGREARAMVDGGHRELSIGYTVVNRDQSRSGTVVVTRWVLHEVSIVAIPADATIGVARSFDGVVRGGVTTPVSSRAADGTMASMSTNRTTSRQPAQSFDLLRAIGVLGNPEPVDYSAELPRAMVDATRAAADGFYREGYAGNCARLPLGLLMQQRDLSMGVASAGGYLAGAPRILPQTSLAGLSDASALGVRIIDWTEGGSPTIPAVSTSISNYGTDAGPPEVTLAGFVGEGGDVIEDDLVFSAATANPATVGVTFKVSRKVVKQGGAIANQLIVGDALQWLFSRFDWALLSGRGDYNEPTGVANLSGLALELDGTDLEWRGIQSVLAAVHAAGARPDRLSWVGGTGARQLLGERARRLVTDTGTTPVSAQATGPAIWDGDTIDKRPAITSRQCVSDTLIVGDFSRVFMVVQGLSLLVDPRYDVSGTHRVTLLADVDILAPQPAAFAVVRDIT